MSSKGYSHINKYFALMFMMFAVLSGVPDNYKDVNVVNAKNDYSPYFFRINQLLTQNIGKIRAQILVNKYNDFSSYVQSIVAEKDVFNYIHIYLAFGALVFALFYLNNQMMQNHIWRKAVF